MWSEVAGFEKVLHGFFPDLDEWPADAQMGLLSMAWAMGPHFPRSWPHFSAACEVRQWEAVATPHGVPSSCQMHEAGTNASFKMRNAANLVLFGNADVVVARGIDPDILQWPLDLGSR